jgi:hypothetical protein
VALSSAASRRASGAASDLTERASPLAALPASIKNVGVLKTVGIVFPPQANYESDGTIAEGPRLRRTHDCVSLMVPAVNAIRLAEEGHP